MNGSRFTLSVFSTALLWMATNLHAADCPGMKGIASNEVVGLAGSHDTAWVLTHEGSGKYAVTTITGSGNLSARAINDSNWNTQYLCNTSTVRDMAFLNGTLAVATDSQWHQPNSFFLITTNKGITSREVSFPWADTLKKIDDFHVAALEVTECSDAFYFACLDGGVVRWDPKSDQMRVLIPGAPQQPISNYTKPLPAAKNRHVVSVNSSGNRLVVTASAKVWLYNEADSSWDTTISATTGESGVTVDEFRSAFINGHSGSSPLYAYAKLSGGIYSSDSLVLCKYDRIAALWRVLMVDAPSAITFGPNGIFYAVKDNNLIMVFRDTLPDGIPSNLASLILPQSIQDSMTGDYAIDFPRHVYDLMFTSVNDSTGILWIATSDGLFIAENISEHTLMRQCVLVKRSPNVTNGLKKTYARPGILTTNFWDGQQKRAVFIYNLSKDAKVTIKVYDYNMDHVKTVISGKLRKAGNNGGPFGRSTVESEDWWDGSNTTGRTVVPGVYYYRITTDSGERSTGKIVVAK